MKDILMQVRVPSKRRIAAMAALVLAGACSDPGFEVPSPVTVEIERLERSLLFMGERVVLEATVTGSDNQQVTWRSTNPEVATVDSTGLVITRDSGSTWIVATAQIDAQRSDSIGLEVDYFVVQVPGPWITVVSIVKAGTATDVDKNAVAGSITVTAQHDWPPEPLPVLRVLLNDHTVCEVQLTIRNGSNECTIDTTAFPNGPATLKAQLVAETGIYANVTIPLILEN